MAAEVFLTLSTVILGFLTGMCLGSFSSALIWRLPQKKEWFYLQDKEGRFKGFVRSQCPSCERTLSGLDLIPLISWSWQRGKCRSCGSKISIIYPLLEIGAGVIGILLFIVMGLFLTTFIAALFITFSFIFLWVGIRNSLWSRQILLILIFLALLFLVFTGF